MMNSTSQLPPVPAAADLASFRDLLALLADPKQAAERLKQIDAAATELRSTSRRRKLPPLMSSPTRF